MVDQTNSGVSHLHPRPSFELADHPWPTHRDEIWRFAPLDKARPLFGEDADWTQVVLSIQAPKGVIVDSQAPGSSRLVPVDRPSAIAAASSWPATHVVLNNDVAEPVLIEVDAQSRQVVANLVIDATAGSKGVVVLRHSGVGTCVGNVEINVGEGADLTVVSLQDWDESALHAGFHQGFVGANAHYRHVAVTFGGSLVRLQNNVSYDGPGGTAELFGLYLTDAGQHHEHRLFVDQNSPKTTSRVDYRGALQGGGAHAVWVGDVLIRPTATGIDSYESNRNLLLTNGCVVDSVPNLEIETGDIIGAGHSSATGHFDDEQLFYLQSRGLPPAVARRLVVQGFLYDIIRHIGVASVEERLRHAVDAELAKAEVASNQEN